jgi:hypothetical protein
MELEIVAFGCGLFVVFAIVFARAVGAIVMERKFDWGTEEWIEFANASFEIALVGPVEELHFAAMNDEPRWTCVGLNDVFELWMSVFEASWSVSDDGVFQDFIEVAGADFGVTSGVDFEHEIKKFGDVFAGFARGDESWGVWDKVEILLELI